MYCTFECNFQLTVKICTYKLCVFVEYVIVNVFYFLIIREKVLLWYIWQVTDKDCKTQMVLEFRVVYSISHLTYYFKQCNI